MLTTPRRPGPSYAFFQAAAARTEQQELKEVLTEEEYETLLHEPGRWKIGLRILEN